MMKTVLDHFDMSCAMFRSGSEIMSGTQTLSKPGRRTAKRDKTTSREALAASIKGKYSWVPYSSEDFNRDKRREIALENRA